MKNAMTQIDVYDRPDNVGVGDDYILQVKVKNGPLLRAIRMRGFKTHRAFAEAAGIDQSSVSDYLALKKAGRDKTGAWTPTTLKMARALALPPDCLFPEQHVDKPLPQRNAEISVSAAELGLLMGPASAGDPEAELIRAQLCRRLTDLMSRKLTPREERVLRLRFGLDDGQSRTCDQVAEGLGGVSGARIHQLELKALRKLGRPGGRKQIEAVADGRWGGGSGPWPGRHYVPQWKREQDEVSNG